MWNSAEPCDAETFAGGTLHGAIPRSVLGRRASLRASRGNPLTPLPAGRFWDRMA